MGDTVSTENGNTEELLYSGWMSKKGKVNTNWKKRYFELYNNGKLYYYSDEQKPTKKTQKGVADLSTATTLNISDNKNFNIVTPNRTWYFQCNFESECDQWIQCITNKWNIRRINLTSEDDELLQMSVNLLNSNCSSHSSADSILNNMSDINHIMDSFIDFEEVQEMNENKLYNCNINQTYKSMELIRQPTDIIQYTNMNDCALEPLDRMVSKVTAMTAMSCNTDKTMRSEFQTGNHNNQTKHCYNFNSSKMLFRNSRFFSEITTM